MYFVLKTQLSVLISISVRLGDCEASQDTGRELCADSTYHLSLFIIKLLSSGLNCFCFPFCLRSGCYPLKSTHSIIKAVIFRQRGDLDRMVIYSTVKFLGQFDVF